jgi:amino acid transporter
MFAVANSALINMLMASRLLYGLARQGVLPHVLGTVHPTRRTPWVSILFTTALAFGLIYFVVTNSQAQAISLLGGTTALLLLCVFTIVNVALIVLRRRPPVGHAHFRAPGPLPWVGAATCAFLAGPWARSAAQLPQYRIAAWLLAIGIVLWACTWAWNRLVRHRTGGLEHPEELAEHHGGAPTN